MKQRVHILGASGSGTTTIARAICNQVGYAHFDSDDYFWLPTPNPFTVEREKTDYLPMLTKDLCSAQSWMLSGSIAGWADELVSLFDLVIFVYVSTDLRVERLKKREAEQYGARILSTGDRYRNSLDFIEWAAAYDSGAKGGRSLAKHELWLKTVPCPVLRIENIDLEKSVKQTMDAICSP